MQISVIDLQDVPIDTECVRRAAGLAAQTRAHDFESVSIVLVNDARITELNREHRGFDSPTDVLSYGSDEEDPEYMGDVLISVDTATRQAASAGRAPLHEIAWLAAHGVLHLLGHDDVADDQRAEMVRIQDGILRKLLDEESVQT